jgi:hypothetical protein
MDEVSPQWLARPGLSRPCPIILTPPDPPTPACLLKCDPARRHKLWKAEKDMAAGAANAASKFTEELDPVF